MFKQLKMKIATRRLQREKQRKSAAAKRKKATFWGRVWNVITAPFRMIGRGIRYVWEWIRTIDMIGLVNLTLLIAIIVLFAMLIIDIVNCNKKPVVVVADTPAVMVTPAPRPQISVTDDAAPRVVKPRQTLPLRRDPATRKFIDRPITVVKSGAPVVPCDARPARNLQGDIIVDRTPGTPVLTDGVHIHGNLFLQNMRKYTLPCGAVIHGNLFLRDVNMLQFCGDFTVTGNIYVSPRSSFGPIPRTARLGGQVIL